MDPGNFDNLSQSPWWPEIVSFNQKEAELLFRHFATGENPTYSSYSDDGIMYESWTADGKVYVALINRTREAGTAGRLPPRAGRHNHPVRHGPGGGRRRTAARYCQWKHVGSAFGQRLSSLGNYTGQAFPFPKAPAAHRIGCRQQFVFRQLADSR